MDLHNEKTYLKFIRLQKTSTTVVFTFQDQTEKHYMGIVSQDYAVPAPIRHFWKTIPLLWLSVTTQN